MREDDHNLETIAWPGFVDILSSVIIMFVFFLMIVASALYFHIIIFKSQILAEENVSISASAEMQELAKTNRFLTEKIEEMKEEMKILEEISQENDIMLFKEDAEFSESETQEVRSNFEDKSILIFFDSDSISVTAPNQTILDEEIKKYIATYGAENVEATIISSKNPSSLNDIVARRLAVARLLNVRNAFLETEIPTSNLTPAVREGETFLTFSCILGLFLSPAFAQAEEDNVELSLSTIILFAMDQNPDLNIAKSRIDQMEFFVDEARADYYPKIEMRASGGFEHITTLNQSLFNGFQTSSEIARREELRETANIDLEIQKSNLVLEVVKHYLDILKYKRLVTKTEVFVERINDIVGTITDMVEAGAAGKVMLDYAESRQAAAYVQLNEANSFLSDSMSNLEFLTGPLPPFDAVEPYYLAAQKLDKSFYVDKAAVESDPMNRVASEIDAINHQISAEQGGFYPSVDLALEAEQTHDDGGDVGRSRNLKATVNFTYELFDGFERRSRLSRVNGQLKELHFKEQKIIDELNRDIDIAYSQIVSLESTLKATKVEIQSARALQRLNKENFLLGEINVIELIEGEERLQGAYARQYDLERDLFNNIYTLLINSSIINESFFCDLCGANNDS